ncbi:MAG TPA: DNA polymerase III subunit beta [Patescibacteria group bacterium]|nr:DNA polymerase III subunit beta [Patescibacteria group bacterium]
MKATLLAENLQKKISFLNHAVSTRSQLPILSNILIETKKGKLKMSATDLEIGIITHVPANIEEEGSVTVPAKTFSELVANINEGKIELSLENKALVFKGPRVKAVFQTMPAEDFPKIYEEKGEEVARIARGEIEKEFSRVVFSAAQDTGRPALSGVLLGQDVKDFTVVATDGYRLSLRRGLSAGGKKGESVSMLIPARVIRELFSIKDEGEYVSVLVSNESSQVIFSQGETILVGRLIEAEYPAYEKILPSSFSTLTTFGKAPLLNAVKICSVFARDTANIVKFSIEKEKIIVSANTPSVGENRVEIEAKTEGEENEIAFNARYLLDFLGNIDDEDILFEMTGPLNPGVFKIKGEPNFLHLIMPIRVQE